MISKHTPSPPSQCSIYLAQCLDFKPVEVCRWLIDIALKHESLSEVGNQ